MLGTSRSNASAVSLCHHRATNSLTLSGVRHRAMIGTIVAEPIRSSLAGVRIGAPALADLLGRWPAGDGALYRLLALRIARLADTGELSPGLRLPPERELAAALSVSRNTVAAAYQLLRDEGMAETRQGAGTRITPHRTTPAAVHRANGFFSGMLESAEVAADLTLSIVDCAPQVAAALTDPASVADAGAMRAVLETSGYFPHGLPVLREVIADHLTRRLGLPSSPDEVMVTTGSQQALDLVIRTEVLPGQPVAVEDPTFPGVLDTLHRCGASVIGIPADGGLDPARGASARRPGCRVPGDGVRRRHDARRAPAARRHASAAARRLCGPRDEREPGDGRLAVQDLLGRPAHRLDPRQHRPGQQARRREGGRRPRQPRILAADRGGAAGRPAR